MVKYSYYFLLLIFFNSEIFCQSEVNLNLEIQSEFEGYSFEIYYLDKVPDLLYSGNENNTKESLKIDIEYELPIVCSISIKSMDSMVNVVNIFEIDSSDLKVVINFKNEDSNFKVYGTQFQRDYQNLEEILI